MAKRTKRILSEDAPNPFKCRRIEEEDSKSNFHIWCEFAKGRINEYMCMARQVRHVDDKRGITWCSQACPLYELD